MQVRDMSRQCRSLRQWYNIFLDIREKRNPLKALIIGYVVIKAILLRYLFGITKLSSYLTLLDNDCTKLVLRIFGAKIGPDCYIDSHIFIHNAHRDFGNLRIGSGCHIGKDTLFDLRSAIIIDDFVTISMRTTIITHFSVGKSSLINLYPRESAPVQIMKNSPAPGFPWTHI
jgi:acetyltransferase-like isoleucine patch superfamily enzyme